MLHARDELEIEVAGAEEVKAVEETQRAEEEVTIGVELDDVVLGLRVHGLQERGEGGVL